MLQIQRDSIRKNDEEENASLMVKLTSCNDRNRTMSFRMLDEVEMDCWITMGSAGSAVSGPIFLDDTRRLQLYHK